MRLLEWQSRELLEQAGIPVPGGRVAGSPEEAEAVVAELGRPCVLKAQVPIGGRGKAGGIRRVDSPQEAEKIAGELFQMKIRGFKVASLLVVAASEVGAEHYLGITVDRRRGVPVFIYSPSGGVDIEEAARSSPGSVHQQPVPVLEGLQPFRLRRLLASAPTPLKKDLARVARQLYSVFDRYEANLAEINPLAETSEGLLALDAKIVIGDDHRPGPQFEGLVEFAQDPLEAEAEAAGFSYVGLDGDVGVIGNGAGLVMATLDLVAAAGGSPANFLDIGGGARAERVRAAVELVRRSGKANVLFVNVFGGITRCDEVARGVIEGVSEHGSSLPVVVRLSGTNAAEGARALDEAGLVPVASMEDGATRAVALSRREA